MLRTHINAGWAPASEARERGISLTSWLGRLVMSASTGFDLENMHHSIQWKIDWACFLTSMPGLHMHAHSHTCDTLWGRKCFHFSHVPSQSLMGDNTRECVWRGLRSKRSHCAVRVVITCTAPCFNRVISFIASFVHLQVNLKYFTKLQWSASLGVQHWGTQPERPGPQTVLHWSFLHIPVLTVAVFSLLSSQTSFTLSSTALVKYGHVPLHILQEFYHMAKCPGGTAEKHCT